MPRREGSAFNGDYRTYKLIRLKDGSNLFCEDSATGETAYFCQVSEEGHLKLHRGAQGGPVIATADPCLVTPGATDIHLLSPKSVLQLAHPHDPGSDCQSYFEFNGVRYGWDGHSELFEREDGTGIARFYASWDVVDEGEHQIGKLVITKNGKSMEDVIVMTALVVQERSEEAREAAFHRRSLPSVDQHARKATAEHK